MAWTPDGMTILACSGDGTIALLMFSEKELGKPLSQVHFRHHHVCITCPDHWSHPTSIPGLWEHHQTSAISPDCLCQPPEQGWYVWHLASCVLHAAHMSCFGAQGNELLQEEVDQHIQGLYGSMRPQQMLFAESAGQLRLEAAAEEGQGAARVPAALPMPRPRPAQPATGLADRLAPANGIAQPRMAQQLLARYKIFSNSCQKLADDTSTVVLASLSTASSCVHVEAIRS